MFIILIFSTVGFGQINWEIEIVDSLNANAPLFDFSSLALDTSDIPHIVYNKSDFSKVFYASRINSDWRKEIIESGLFYYGFSLIFDDNNIPHLSYYRKDDVLKRTYICYARKEADNWQIEEVDSFLSHPGNLFWDITSSISLDTLDLPGIAYIAWNAKDSLCYIKFAHYNGTNWDTSVVEYDTAYVNTQISITDYSPSLKFNSKNIPYICFQQIYNHYDTLKIAYYDDTLNFWIVEPVIDCYGAGIPVSLELSSQDYPYIAHCLWGDLHCTWWDGLSWHSEGITPMGWHNIKINLALDSLDNPHIAYLPDPMVGHPCYCYKRNNTWILCGWIEPDPSTLTLRDISLALDSNDQPHVCYQFVVDYTTGIKYAKGTFVGVKEGQDADLHLPILNISPNPFRDRVEIRLKTTDERLMTKDISLKIYDVGGRVVKNFPLSPVYNLLPPIIWDGRDSAGNKIPSGVYFLQLRIGEHRVMRKTVLIR